MTDVAILSSADH